MLRQELRVAYKALFWLAQDMHTVYPRISEVAINANALCVRYQGYAQNGVRPKLPIDSKD